MRAHRSSCRWFWAWTAVGFGLAFGFLGIFSIGPFLLPFVTLLLGVTACRRPAPWAIGAGLALAAAGIAAALELSVAAFLVTPLVTLVIGLSPGLARAGIARVVLLAAVVAACAVAVVSASPAPDTALAVIPLALVAFAAAAAGRLDAEASGAIAGAALAGAALGGPPVLLLAAAAGVSAFPLLRVQSGAPSRG